MTTGELSPPSVPVEIGAEPPPEVEVVTGSDEEEEGEGAEPVEEEPVVALP